MSLPASIRKRDGRHVPFEPERISRSLFAVTELMGGPNAFLARELTDGVLHFISLEPYDSPPTTSDLADLVTKVVRELGYPAIARVYEESIRTVARQPGMAPREQIDDRRAPTSPTPTDSLTAVHRAAREQLRTFSLSRVYPRDLVSAHRNGLLCLLDLDHPHEMAGVVLSPQPSPCERWDLLEAIVGARAVAGSFIALDCPEIVQAGSKGAPDELVDSFLKALDRSLELTGLQAILNLNIASSAPSQFANSGPLFQDMHEEIERNRIDAIADILLQRATRQAIFWHLSERDLHDNAVTRLRASVERGLAHPHVEFVFDRGRQPVKLGPGIDRDKTAAVGFVGMNLLELAEQIGGNPIDPNVFLRKLGSLARFAKSAGHARQDFLRKNGRPELQHGFLLERAVEVVIPEGVLESARRVLGGLADADQVQELARQSLETIRDALEADRPRAMTTRIDWFDWNELNYSIECLTDINSLPRQQLRSGSKLLKACGGGGLTVQHDPEQLGLDEMLELLRMAYRLPDIDRLCFVKPKPPVDEKTIK